MSQAKPKFNLWSYVNRQAARGEDPSAVQRRCSRAGGAASAAKAARRAVQQERFITMMHQQKLESP